MPTELTKNARIIVVDDEPMNVDLFGAILRDAGYANLLMITDSRQAAPMCAHDDPDLVLLDLHMPHQDGYEVLQSLRYLVPAEAFMPSLCSPPTSRWKHAAGPWLPEPPIFFPSLLTSSR